MSKRPVRLGKVEDNGYPYNPVEGQGTGFRTWVRLPSGPLKLFYLFNQLLISFAACRLIRSSRKEKRKI